jgi:hypothetical protein
MLPLKKDIQFNIASYNWRSFVKFSWVLVIESQATNLTKGVCYLGCKSKVWVAKISMHHKSFQVLGYIYCKNLTWCTFITPTMMGWWHVANLAPTKHLGMHWELMFPHGNPCPPHGNASSHDPHIPHISHGHRLKIGIPWLVEIMYVPILGSILKTHWHFSNFWGKIYVDIYF